MTTVNAVTEFDQATAPAAPGARIVFRVGGFDDERYADYRAGSRQGIVADQMELSVWCGDETIAWIDASGPPGSARMLFEAMARMLRDMGCVEVSEPGAAGGKPVAAAGGAP